MKMYEKEILEKKSTKIKTLMMKKIDTGNLRRLQRFQNLSLFRRQVNTFSRFAQYRSECLINERIPGIFSSERSHLNKYLVLGSKQSSFSSLKKDEDALIFFAEKTVSCKYYVSIFTFASVSNSRLSLKLVTIAW